MKKLTIKKVTLRDLDDPTMQGMAGGVPPMTVRSTCATNCKCPTQAPARTCCEGECDCGL